MSKFVKGFHGGGAAQDPGPLQLVVCVCACVYVCERISGRAVACKCVYVCVGECMGGRAGA